MEVDIQDALNNPQSKAFFNIKFPTDASVADFN